MNRFRCNNSLTQAQDTTYTITRVYTNKLRQSQSSSLVPASVEVSNTVCNSPTQSSSECITVSSTSSISETIVT